MGDGLRKAKEYFDKAKPRSKGSAGRESAEKSREQGAKELKERVLDEKVSYSSDEPKVRYTGKQFGPLKDDVDSQVRLKTGDTFDVVKEDSTKKRSVLSEIVERASDPKKVHTLTDRERNILEDAGYEQPANEVAARRQRSNMLSDAADAISRYRNDGREASPEWVGPKIPYKKRSDAKK